MRQAGNLNDTTRSEELPIIISSSRLYYYYSARWITRDPLHHLHQLVSTQCVLKPRHCSGSAEPPSQFFGVVCSLGGGQIGAMPGAGGYMWPIRLGGTEFETIMSHHS